jgi:WD40 repeat protein
MSFLRVHQFVIALALFAICLANHPSPGQEAEPEASPNIIVANDPADGNLRSEIEPGIVLYGKSRRFAEVGQCQGFDSSPDGRTLVFASNKLKFFDLRENKVTDEIGEPQEYYSGVLYSPDGRYVFAQSNVNGNTVVRVFDAIDLSSVGTISSKKEDSEKPTYFYAQSICVSADAKYLAMASHDEVQVRDVSSGELVCGLKDLGYVQGMAFSPDETELFIPKMGRLAVLDVKSGELKEKSESKLVGQYGNALDVNLSRNLLAIPQSTGVSLFDLKQQQSAGTIPLPQRVYGQSVQFSDDGSLLAVNAWEQDSGTSRMVVVVVNVDTKQVVRKLNIPSQGVTRQRFSSDNKHLLVSGHSIYGILDISIDNGDDNESASYPVGPAQTGLIHPDGNSFMTCSQGGEVTWFDSATGKVLRSIQKPNLRSAELTNDGSDVLLVSQWGNVDGIARVSYKTGKPKKSYGVQPAAETGSIFKQIRKFMNNSGPSFNEHSQAYAMAAKLSDDGSELNTLMMEMTYRPISTGVGTTMEQEMDFRFVKMDAENGKRLGSRKFNPEDYGFGKNEWVQNAAIRSDGIQFAIPRGNKVFVVDTQTGETISENVTADYDNIRSLNYSPDGRFLAVSGNRGLWIWDTANGEMVKNFEGRGQQDFDFSKDGSRLAICSRDSRSDVEVYETDSWKKILEGKQTKADRSCVALSEDGQKLLIGLVDCRVEIWDLTKLSQ